MTTTRHRLTRRLLLVTLLALTALALGFVAPIAAALRPPAGGGMEWAAPRPPVEGGEGGSQV